MCHLLQYLCDCQVRHRIEAVVAFSDDFVANLQDNQRFRYNEVMQALNMSAALTARKTKEFRSPPQEQVRWCLILNITLLPVLNLINSCWFYESNNETKHQLCGQDCFYSFIAVFLYSAAFSVFYIMAVRIWEGNVHNCHALIILKLFLSFYFHASFCLLHVCVLRSTCCWILRMRSRIVRVLRTSVNSC